MSAEIKAFGRSTTDAGKQQFLDHIARSYDEYVADHGHGPEGLAYVLLGTDGASSTWLMLGSLEGHAAAYVSWAANILHGRAKLSGDGE